MDWNKASSIAEVLSSIAILVTLVYLAVEIQQGAEATRAQTRQAILDSDQQLLNMLVTNPELSLIWYKTELSDAEKTRLSYLLVTVVRMRESNWFQFKNGTLDDASWNTYSSTLVAVLSSPQTRHWWHNFGVERLFNAEFVSVVDQKLDGTPIFEESPHIVAFD